MPTFLNDLCSFFSVLPRRLNISISFLHTLSHFSYPCVHLPPSIPAAASGVQSHPFSKDPSPHPLSSPSQATSNFASTQREPSIEDILWIPAFLAPNFRGSPLNSASGPSSYRWCPGMWLQRASAHLSSTTHAHAAMPWTTVLRMHPAFRIGSKGVQPVPSRDLCPWKVPRLGECSGCPVLKFTMVCEQRV